MQERKFGLRDGLIAAVALVLLGVIILIGRTPPCSSTTQNAANQRILAISLGTSTWNVEDCKVYYQSTVINGADIATFEPLPEPNPGYSKDKNYVYYVASIIEGADPSTFKLIDSSSSGENYFETDKNHVYDNQGVLIAGADPNSFQFIGDTKYEKDDAHVFYGTELVNNADPETFNVLGYYAEDKNSMYFGADPIPNSDPSTFKAVADASGSALYFEDKNQIYTLRDGVITGSDPSTFTLLDSDGYSLDASNIYYLTSSLPMADRATFESLADGFAQDKNYLYEDGQVIFDVNKNGYNAFTKEADYLQSLMPEDDNTAIATIVASYYDLTLYYGNGSSDSLFYSVAGPSEFFQNYDSSLKDVGNGWNAATLPFPAFRLAFVATGSQAFSTDFPYSAGAAMGGDIVSQKYLDANTVLVCAEYETESYLGPEDPSVPKTDGSTTDQFVFKKIDGQWKISELYPDVQDCGGHLL